MLTFLISALIPFSIVVLLRFINYQNNPSILGIYRQQNKYYWPKFIILYCLLKFRQLYTHLKRILSVEFGKSPDGQKHVHKYDVNLEEIYDLKDYPYAVDSIFFNGVSKRGATVICNIARRQNEMCDAFLYVKVDGEDLLLSPSLPETHLKQLTSEEVGFNVQGLSITNFMPMRTWIVNYSGEMKSRDNPEKTVKVELTLTWGASWKFFNYNLQISPRCLADAIAKEKWSIDYFSTILNYFCRNNLPRELPAPASPIQGTIKIDNKEHELNMPCSRTHSFGRRRDWRNLHRYVYHFIFLENGDSIAIGSFSKPIAFSNIPLGYICRKEDQSIIAADESDFKLYQHGENEILPSNYAFTFKAGGQPYVVSVKVTDETVFYMGQDRETKFYQRWCSFEVNGVKGWGSAEWQYNNVQNLDKRRVQGPYSTN